MPQAAWSDKRKRQKDRARSGEARQRSATSTHDISSARHGGLRLHSGLGGRTKEQLYGGSEAKGVEGRSKMIKAQLESAIGRQAQPSSAAIAERPPSPAPNVRS